MPESVQTSHFKALKYDQTLEDQRNSMKLETTVLSVLSTTLATHANSSYSIETS